MNLIKCKQCGEIKANDNYRDYYNGKGNKYKICKTCEKINSRCKYLVKKEGNNTLSNNEAEELQTIRELYEILSQKGLTTPRIGQGRESSMIGEVSALLDRHKKDVEEIKQQHEELGVGIKDDLAIVIPAELAEWLQKPLESYRPEYLQDVVYESLQATYRPITGVSSVSLTPIYDDRFRDVLNKILQRFDEYEDNYEDK